MAVAEPVRHLDLLETPKRGQVMAVRGSMIPKLLLELAEQHLGIGHDDSLAENPAGFERLGQVGAGLGGATLSQTDVAQVSQDGPATAEMDVKLFGPGQGCQKMTLGSLDMSLPQ